MTGFCRRWVLLQRRFCRGGEGGLSDTRQLPDVPVPPNRTQQHQISSAGADTAVSGAAGRGEVSRGSVCSRAAACPGSDHWPADQPSNNNNSVSGRRPAAARMVSQL